VGFIRSSAPPHYFRAVPYGTLIEIQFFTYRYRILGLKMTITIRYLEVFI
jgi:hypothetical protein